MECNENAFLLLIIYKTSSIDGTDYFDKNFANVLAKYKWCKNIITSNYIIKFTSDKYEFTVRHFCNLATYSYKCGAKFIFFGNYRDTIL